MKDAFTYQRIAAYLIDIILIGIIAALITFWIPESETYKNAIKEQDKLMEDYKSGEIDASKYIDKTYEIRYTIDKEVIPTTLISIVLSFAYFATFAFYNKGQTLGKKLLRIKIVNQDNKEVTHGQLMLRALIINECFFNLLSIVLLLFIKSNQYSYTVGTVTMVQSAITLASLIMVIARKDKKGLHDLICKTKVVQI